MFKTFFLTLAVLLSVQCKYDNHKKDQAISKQEFEAAEKSVMENSQQYEVAYFASGCFWCVEAIYEDVIGVHEVVSGYAGGKEKNPTYEQVGRGLTTHAEAVRVHYDPKKVSFETLVKVFFASHDPTTLNRQGPDHGPQYRSIAFYSNETEKTIIDQYIVQLKKDRVYQKPIVTEVKKIGKFYDAEDYHQDFEKRNPRNPYILNISIPRYKRFQAKHPELLKKNSH